MRKNKKRMIIISGLKKDMLSLFFSILVSFAFICCICLFQHLSELRLLGFNSFCIRRVTYVYHFIKWDHEQRKQINKCNTNL